MNKKFLPLIALGCMMLAPGNVAAQAEYGAEYIKMTAEQSPVGKSKRPAEKDRLFRSKVIDQKIVEVKKILKDNPYLAWMFENCFPNTLETTVHYRVKDGDDDTFVYTGDIHAMWLRDSGAQGWP